MNKRLVGIIIFFLVNILGGFIGVSFYIGLFSEVTLQEKKMPHTKMILKKHYGTYKKVGKKILDVKNFLEANTSFLCRSVTVYYSDDKKVIQRLLESAGGCIVDDFPNIKIPSTFFSLDSKTLFLSKKEIKSLPLKNIYLTTKAHPGIGYNKMIISLRKYAKKNNLNIQFPILETWNSNGYLEYWASVK